MYTILIDVKENCPESSPASSLSPPEGASSWTHHFTPHTCAPTHHFTQLTCAPDPLITLSCSQWVDYLCTSAPSLCLPRLHLPALTCACNVMYVHYISCLTDYIRFRALGTPALRCRLGCPVADYCFVLPVGIWFNKEKKLTCIWTQISTFSTGSLAVPWQKRDYLEQVACFHCSRVKFSGLHVDLFNSGQGSL